MDKVGEKINKISDFSRRWVKMVARNKICPCELILKKVEGPGLRSIIKNVSKKLQAFICENYWHPTRINIFSKDGIKMDWRNVYPPVEPPPPAYIFLEPGGQHTTNEEHFVLNDKYEIRWAQAQEFILEPGNYQGQVTWECYYGENAIYDTYSYEQSYFISNELDKQWTGQLRSNNIGFKLT
jgi:hypothetical protein